jgi:pyruvate kinase
MNKNPRPTRAEATDIANAIYDGTTAIMLSGETAAGAYPLEAVRTMARIAEAAEKDIDYRGRMYRYSVDNHTDTTTAISFATCSIAMDLKAAAIITVTLSGFTAEMVARYKPACQIIGCSTEPQVLRQMNLLYGVKPLEIDKEYSADVLFVHAAEEAKKAGYVNSGDIVVITAGLPLGVAGRTNMIRVLEVR